MKLLQTALVLTSLAFITMAGPAVQAHNVAPTFPAPSSSPLGNYCGKAELTDGHLRELRTSEPWNKCNTLDQDENYDAGLNQYCGLCIMFKNDECQGKITYWGGKGAGWFKAKGARSYYCV
ncbi:hypothetical protein N0V91_003186 [Didymella pomorum]|uniref:Uncharacterized protein n=1 Tax=Didymella pomorum TaxID=749634 RepID=A0A9W8ZIU0_9PLEO|nr:hypothetical protein N0V91_003186 [Didymella pomorum]